MNKRWEWHRCIAADWETPEIDALDFGTLGFLHVLHSRMICQMSPVSEEAIVRLARSRSINRKTVDRMLKTLVTGGLIYRTDEGYWRDAAAREVEYREEISRKTSKRNEIVSQKRWSKIQRNQRREMPEEEIDKRGKPHQGAYPQTIVDDAAGYQAPAKKHAPSLRLEAASGASIVPDDDGAWFFEEREFEEFLEGDDPVEFLGVGDPDLPIRATDKDWRRLLTWIGETYGPEALRQATKMRREDTLTIETICGFRRRSADVA